MSHITPPGSGYGEHPAEDGGTQPPVCRRHPDRVAYVRCQRCGQPACPECQRPAEVGIRCVSCVKEAHQALPRELRPARFTDRRGQPIPIVTYTLIGLCVLAFAGQWLTDRLMTGGGLTEAWWYVGLYTSEVSLTPELAAMTGLSFEPWRMITSAFVHSLTNPLHLVLNMVVLYMIGRGLEPIMGWARFLALYLISAIGGSVAVLWLSAPNVPVVGASGAVYGLFAALFILARRTGGNVTSIAALIAVNLAFSFAFSGISWQGHIGGLVTGAACAAVIYWIPRRRKDGTRVPAAVTWLGLAGVVVLLGILTWWGGSLITLEALLENSVS